MDKGEKIPFVTDLKNKYGAGGNNYVKMNNNERGSVAATPPPTIYCLHGQEKRIELRGHCHRQRTEGVDVKARKKLIIASILCLLFMVAEIIGGVLSNSLAIATDAAHLLTDFASFMISLFAIWLAGRPSTQRMSFGWYRAEVIGALASVVMIWVITAILVWLAVQRLISGEFEVNAKIMLITSALAIVVNLIMGFQLQHSHSHGGASTPAGHGHAHDGATHHDNNAKRTATVLTIDTPTNATPTVPSTTTATPQPSADNNNIYPRTPVEETIERGLILADTNLTTNKQIFSYQNSNGSGDTTVAHATPHSDSIASSENEIENMNVRAAFIHVLGDVLQSVGVFLAALVIYFKPEWAIADPICTFVFSVIVLFTTFSIMKDALLVLMEGTPSYLHYAEVMEIFLGIEGVERVHNLRIWALSINKIALSAHLAVGCSPANEFGGYPYFCILPGCSS